SPAMALFAQELRWAKKKNSSAFTIHPHNLPFHQVRLGERLLQTFSFFNDQTVRPGRQAAVLTSDF
ncbi:MAG: hypothetical protein K9K64_11910, partial [Desulfohalobiaceae bacterium]|nr:hypothetical protein [Desulfohalobiaceae bacterium]